MSRHILFFVECSVPILWENADDTYAYSVGATGFLVAFTGDFYVITARHNLKERTVQELLVPYEPTGKSFAPLEAAVNIATASVEEDTDYKDIVFLKIARSLVPVQSLVGPHWFDFHFRRYVPELLPNEKLLVAGYPMSLQHIDYDPANLRRQRLIADGTHVGPGEGMHCHILQFNDLSIVPDAVVSEEPLSGISGAPVFLLRSQGALVVPYLAGMMLRATKAFSRGRFVHSQVLFRALELIRAGESRVVTSPIC